MKKEEFLEFKDIYREASLKIVIRWWRLVGNIL